MRILLVYSNETVLEPNDRAEIAANIFGNCSVPGAIEVGNFLTFTRMGYWEAMHPIIQNCHVDMYYASYHDAVQDDSLVVALYGSEWFGVGNEFMTNKMLREADESLDKMFSSDGTPYQNAVGAMIYVKALYDLKFDVACVADTDCFRGVAFKFEANEHAMQAVDRSIMKKDYTPPFMRVVK